MEQPESKDYFRRRAEEELAKAEQCGDGRAAQAHRDLARCYREQADAAPEDAGAPNHDASNILPKDFRILP
jgi:hypothetical protein